MDFRFAEPSITVFSIRLQEQSLATVLQYTQYSTYRSTSTLDSQAFQHSAYIRRCWVIESASGLSSLSFKALHPSSKTQHSVLRTGTRPSVLRTEHAYLEWKENKKRALLPYGDTCFCYGLDKQKLFGMRQDIFDLMYTLVKHIVNALEKVM